MYSLYVVFSGGECFNYYFDSLEGAVRCLHEASRADLSDEDRYFNTFNGVLDGSSNCLRQEGGSFTMPQVQTGDFVKLTCS